MIDPTQMSSWRRTSQDLAPAVRPGGGADRYALYPAYPLDEYEIRAGFETLAERLASEQSVIFDGYGGVFWEDFRERLSDALDRHGVQASWQRADEALLPEQEITALVAPFLGGDDPLFGTRFTGELRSFFDPDRLAALRPDPSARVNILYGCGSALAGWPGLLIYVDLPKNEIQFRARAGSIRNLGTTEAASSRLMYKRFYFVDWIALNRHKAALLPSIGLVIDAQRPDLPTWMSGDGLRTGLHRMSSTALRVRPWFEPGPWGGQWIKHKIPDLPQAVPNYAWSFELIVPENGIAFESDGHLLEVSFDFLMFQEAKAVLGDAFGRFGTEFPIRFDFLDTVGGGNLSLQCHPSPGYIRDHFGEPFTQDETYYMLDCEPGARVVLGFQDDVDPDAFRAALEAGFREGKRVDVTRFVQTHPAAKHDLFLIPNRTIHCSGAGSLVLEISATPYIFTFKMYDWNRLDLDGRPRPLNIERAFENLDFERKGHRVAETLLSHPVVMWEDADRRIVHLPTHPDHFYDVHRLEFDREIEADTEGSCQVMSLVEGDSVVLEVGSGFRQRVHYAETFVVPAATGSFRLVNEGPQRAYVIKASIKPTHL